MPSEDLPDKNAQYKLKKFRDPTIKEEFTPYPSGDNQDDFSEAPDESEELIRTQIHLSEAQRKFLNEQARLTGKSMAAQIRELINERMKPKQTDWENNPLLEDTVIDPSFEGQTDASQNSDQHIYGSYEE